MGRALARMFHKAGLRDIVTERLPITLPPGIHHQLFGPAMAAAVGPGTREFTRNGADHATHWRQASMILRYMAWRNCHTADPGSAGSPNGQKRLTRTKSDGDCAHVTGKALAWLS